MPGLKVKVLGKPELRRGKEVIEFPYKKVEGLFYYLIVEKKVSRTRIASLLWGDMPEAKAKKNLRNALYQLRKTIGKDYILSPDRFTIKINEEKIIENGLDKFLAINGNDSADHYRGEFLEDFMINEALGYSEWLREQRSYINRHYIEALKSQINELKKKDKSADLIKYLNELIEIDEFNEKAYQQLIKLYISCGEKARAIGIYKKLEERFKKELGISPGAKTTSLIRGIELDVNNDNFIGRGEELNNLLHTFYRFKREEAPASILITGEAGVGKTTLLEQMLLKAELDNFLVLKTDCFLAEERFIYKPWKTILEQIRDNINLEKINTYLPWKKIISFLFPDFIKKEEVFTFESIQHQSADEALIYFLAEVARRQKLIIIFENLQWSDPKSLELLRALIRKDQNRNILIYATSRRERENHLKDYFSDLLISGSVHNLDLERLDMEEVKEFCYRKMPQYKFSPGLIKVVFQETEGNTFFLVEALKLLASNQQEDRIKSFMTSKSRNILRERIFSVSRKARNILNIISIPFDKISFDLMSRVSGEDKTSLIDILEELVDHNLINETQSVEGRINYKFTHSKLREFVYQSQSRARVCLLHEKIAEQLERKIEGTGDERYYYTRLIYHYRSAGNMMKYLQYMIKEAEIYFHRSHELFPVINDQKLHKNKVLALNQEESQRYLSEIERLISESRHDENREYRQMELKLLDMRSLFSIVQGEYEKALSYQKEVIRGALGLEDLETVISAYEQRASIGIQQENTGLIKESAAEMYNLAVEIESRAKMGTALRYQGIAHLYEKNYQEAESLFEQSLTIFKNLTRYSLGIAANYNYLGEIKRHQSDFSGALIYYERGIGLSEGKNILCGLGVFYINAGLVCYEMGKYDNSEENFNKALDIFDRIQTIWGYASIAYSFKTLLAIKNHNYDQGLGYLQQADSILEKRYKRYWYGILQRVKAEILSLMQGNKKLQAVFGLYLDENGDYASGALKIFREIGAPYEAESVQRLLTEAVSKGGRGK